MGCDITPISNHRLNMTSIAALAEDLAKRLQINIEYGYCDLYGLGKYYNNVTGNDCIVLGSAGNYPQSPRFTLRDDDFLERELYKLHGRDFFKSEAYLKQLHAGHISDKELDNLIRSFNWPRYELRNEADGGMDIAIYKECLDCGFYYYSRWWAFCHAVMEQQYVDKDALNRYRRNMMGMVEKTGGNKIYYVNDQDRELEGVGQSGEGEMTWKELETFIAFKGGNCLVNIPEYNLNAAYRESLAGYNLNDLMFVDDFRDLT